ncbi:PREDICTED: WAT1-related protein At3g28050 [Tarenaya hassleriana]|uniref:WAT1-related protein At3g28050 n=1 Tax=Tarenaya hassleriana TaxID=28532 RepID=UPI00053C2A6E|nr:PREDICTED: WAT1-related protein At3g28050 [Tarenaya hassleriana]
MERKYLKREVLPITALVIMECANVGLNTLFKAATLQGMDFHVFIVYSYALAALLLLPSIFFSSRSRALPPLRFSILRKILLLGLIGCCSNMMGYTGINYSSPTLASAISNLTPAFTFLLAVLFRMEEVSFKRSSSVAKMLGTAVSITGAFVVTLYKGPVVIALSPPSISLRLSRLQSPNANWTLGAAFLTVEYFLVPLWYIVQTQIMREYPAELTVVCLYSSCVSLFTAIVTLFTEGNNNSWSMWMLKPDIALASIICSGLFGSCINNSIHTWALRIKGPLFVAMFKPLSIAIAVAMGVIFLSDSLYLGSLVGATIITMGFYTVMWGKAKEAEMAEGCNNNEGCLDSSQKVPLLRSCKSDDEHV